MDFFYDIKKKLETLTEGKNAKPDFLDVDKDGDKKEPMKKAAKDNVYKHKGTAYGGQAQKDEPAPLEQRNDGS